ncbi:MAG TPA: FoF1 ATP synthase subunit gamma [Planctomycetota bacterium]|nr:FoF1 ATP synthase subunit gamma [Planctomycetota bacterium]
MRLDELRARIRTASELDGIVRTLRALSEMRLHQGRRMFGSFLRHANEVSRALSRGLALVPRGTVGSLAGESRGRRALFVLGSEHGFVGGLNERVADAALAAVREDPRAIVILAGSRLARTARDRGLASETQLRLATTVSGLERSARSLTDLVAARLARGELAAVAVLGPRRRGEADWEVASDPIFPLPPAVSARVSAKEPPLHYLPARTVVVRLIEEFMFSRMAGAVAEAFLSEQVARVRAMEATRKSLGEKLDELQRAERLARQEVITSDLLEVVSGAEALESEVEGERR